MSSLVPTGRHDGNDPETLSERLLELESRLGERVGAPTPEIQRSALWQLKEMVDGAAVGGKDLIQDLVRRLKRDITAARNRLDAML